MKWSWQPDLTMNDIKVMSVRSMLIFTGGNKVLSARLLDVSPSVVRDLVEKDGRLSDYRASLPGKRPSNRGRARYQWQEHVRVMREEREKRTLENKLRLESERIEEKWETIAQCVDESKEVATNDGGERVTEE